MDGCQAEKKVLPLAMNEVYVLLGCSHLDSEELTHGTVAQYLTVPSEKLEAELEMGTDCII